MEYLAPIANGIITSSLAVPDDTTVNTGSWVLIRKNFFGLEVKFSSDTDVNVQVDLEQSNDKITFVTAIDTIATITDENVHLLPVAPVVAVYARLKLTGLNTGLASNSATTILTRANWVEVES
jgi:hypothetical protein